MKKPTLKNFVVFYLLITCALSARADEDGASIERGRYLVTIGGCNDCHTAGYAEHDSNLPESEWLTGVPVGFNGPGGPAMPPTCGS